MSRKDCLLSAVPYRNSARGQFHISQEMAILYFIFFFRQNIIPFSANPPTFTTYSYNLNFDTSELHFITAFCTRAEIFPQLLSREFFREIDPCHISYLQRRSKLYINDQNCSPVWALKSLPSVFCSFSLDNGSIFETRHLCKIICLKVRETISHLCPVASHVIFLLT